MVMQRSPRVSQRERFKAEIRSARATAERIVFALSGLSGNVVLLPTVGSGIGPDLLTAC
jgi:hypothetical protein